MTPRADNWRWLGMRLRRSPKGRRGDLATYQALRDHCASRPQATARRHLGETHYRIGGRTFAFLGSPADPSITVRAPRDEIARRHADRARVRSRMLERLGWVTIRVDSEATLEVARELIDRSHAEVAARRRR